MIVVMMMAKAMTYGEGADEMNDNDSSNPYLFVIVSFHCLS